MYLKKTKLEKLIKINTIVTKEKRNKYDNLLDKINDISQFKFIKKKNIYLENHNHCINKIYQYQRIYFKNLNKKLI
jgi:hypothetical protein